MAASVGVAGVCDDAGGPLPELVGDRFPEVGLSVGVRERSAVAYMFRHLRRVVPSVAWPQWKAWANAAGGGEVLDVDLAGT
jgi:hypothetical protein